MTELNTGFIAPLLDWYRRVMRPLPWREDREPYHVWVSEIMLQQTRIEAVMRYYARFMEALPDVRALSEVDGDVLLKLWEGLGYYSRARHLKRAAQTIMDDFGGRFPDHYEAIRTLPGVGDYTAGAIASICFDEKVPAVDGNVLRVVARLTGDRRNILLPQTKKAVADTLKEIMPDDAGAFNEALMELGEVVCLPNGAPLCDRCPLLGLCTAHRENLTAELPVRVKEIRRSSARKSVFIIRCGERIAVEKRPDTGLLSGMYQLPNTEGFHPEEELRDVLRSWGLNPREITFLKDAKHVFTHVDWYMKGYAVTVDKACDRFLWATEEELKTACPLPTAFKKLLK